MRFDILKHSILFKLKLQRIISQILQYATSIPSVPDSRRQHGLYIMHYIFIKLFLFTLYFNNLNTFIHTNTMFLITVQSET